MFTKHSFALTTAIAAALPAAALAATPTTAHPATHQSLRIEQAYAFHDSYKPLHRPLVTVIFKTHGQLPRRGDGLVRASAELGSGRGGSIGSVGGRESRCYRVSVPLKDGRLYDFAASGKGEKATTGSKHKLKLFGNDRTGSKLSRTQTVKIVKKTSKSRTGRPIGC